MTAAQLTEDAELVRRLQAREPLLWLKPGATPAAHALQDIAAQHSITLSDIEAADQLLRRWAPALTELFPELAASDGLIESPLIDLPDAQRVTGAMSTGRTLLKADHALPVAGSIKARGGIYEVLVYAETLAKQYGLFSRNADPLQLLGHAATHALPNTR